YNFRCHMRRLLLILIVCASPLAAQVRAPRKPANPPPAPRLKDGTPNLGPIEPNKGDWAPQQYQDYTAIADPNENPYQPCAKTPPLMRKIRRVFKVRPPGFCPAPRRSAHDDHAVPNGDSSTDRTKADRHDLRRGRALMAHHLYGWPGTSEGRCAQPDLDGPFD